MFDKLLVKHKSWPSLGMKVPDEQKLLKEAKKVHENAINYLKNYDGDKVRKTMQKGREIIEKNVNGKKD